MAGGLEVGLALRLRCLRSVAGLVASRKRISDRQRHHLQAEDIFLTPRAWRVGIEIALTKFGAHQMMGGFGGQQHSIAGRLLGKRLETAGPTVREACPSSSARYRSVLDRDIAPVTRALGRDLGGYHLIFVGAVIA
jgi:hypothetical protein